MTELILLFADVLPEEMLIERVEESLLEYKLTKSEESKGSLSMNLMLLLTKFGMTGKDVCNEMKNIRQKEDWIKAMPKSG